jgi:Holliday junction resolvasome RuvABC endonuclease subunit
VIVLGIDPGPTNCGAVLYNTEARAVCFVWKDLTVAEALRSIECGPELVAIERVQSYGIAGASLLRTAEVGGMLHHCASSEGLDVVWLYRREVLRGLDVTGKGNRDSLVRQRLIEIHGGDRASAVGTKAKPGPLYGVASHAWQALAVAVVAGMEAGA